MIPKHHPALVSQEDFDEIQRILEINAPSKERRNMGSGSALLEGKIGLCLPGCSSFPLDKCG